MIGDVIKSLRIRHKLTQKQLASKLGLAQSTIGMIESNKREVSLDNLNKFASFFNVSTDFILGNQCEINNSVDNKLKKNSIHTIAAHFDGVEFTQNDVEDIENFINFVISKKVNK